MISGIEGGKIKNMIIENLRDKTPNDLLNYAGIDSVPVDLVKLFEKLQISVLPTDFANIEQVAEMKDTIKKRGKILASVLLRNSGKANEEVGILFKKDDSIERMRFTVAHELGHCCLHTDAVAEGYAMFSCENDICTDEEEFEERADIFAGELLIPDKFLKEFYYRGDDINYLARCFVVPVDVMKKRLTMWVQNTKN